MKPAAVVVALLCCEGPRRNNKKRTRRWVKWTRQEQIRDEHGLCLLRTELEIEDRHGFGQMLRMTPAEFDIVLGMVEQRIRKQDTKMRRAITPMERLCLTLRFLAAGESFSSLHSQYRIGTSTVAKIVFETCEALYEVMKNDFLKTPTTEAEWRTIAQELKSRWQLPHCLGALDAKHISLQPQQSASSGSDSVILMALVDADYKFIYASVGVQGKVPDAGFFAHSDLLDAMDRGLLNFPPPEPLPNTGINMPFSLVGDEAFPLRSDLMKPYPFRQLDHDQRICNYRLSRALRIAENAFGIFANRWRVFRNAIALEPDRVTTITLASLCLHNFLCGRRSAAYTRPDFVDWEDADHRLVDGTWRLEGMGTLFPVTHGMGGNPPRSAEQQRDILRDYFVSPAGSVEWQENAIDN